MAYDRQLPKKSENISDWYNKVILDAELADYGPAKGTMIFRPYGYRIWELVQAALDAEIKAHGVSNVYFPAFIPESLLNKEKTHVEGFAPELAVVTIGGGEELKEKLVVRPTSETIMYDTYSRWIQSWRDLPVLTNQWSNAVRWEKRTYLFMRTTEFLWQEGHTAHATHEEARDLQKWASDTYAKLYRDWFAIPGYIGEKSESERFAGADSTLTYEALMPGGKALQSSTAHDLGQNFAKAFNITFQSKEGSDEHVWQTSWGLSTRSLGGLIMTHGDDRGLVLPPKLSPVQVVVVPVRDEPSILDYCQQITDQLNKAGIRAQADSRDDESFGFRVNKWELRGVPLRFEVGAREVSNKEVTVAQRDIEKEKRTLNVANDLPERTQQLLDELQGRLLAKAEQFLADNTHEAETYDDFKAIMLGKKGFIRAPWCESSSCEAMIKEETTATTRCLPVEEAKEQITAQCIRCDLPAKHFWLFAQSY